MERARAMSATRVALLGGFLLLLGLVAAALLLLFGASRADAQTSDSQASSAVASESGGAQNSGAQDSAEPVASVDVGASKESNASEPATALRVEVDVQDPAGATDNPTGALSGSIGVGSIEMSVNAPALPALPAIDVPAAVLQLPDVSLALEPDVPALPSVPVRASVAPALPGGAPPAPQVSEPAPSANASSIAGAPPVDAPPPPPTADSTTLPAPTTTALSVSRSQSPSALRAADSSPQGSGPSAPPLGFPPAPAAPGSSLSGLSAGRDLGQNLLLIGIVAAGFMFVLGRGRRLLIEALGWLRAPWCPLMERPG
jgi:hypothetical protein